MKGEKIKEILRMKGLSQNQVAREIGESSQNFSAALAKDDVKTGLVERIAEVTGIPLAVFYGDGHIATANGDGAQAVAGNNVRVEAQTGRFLDELAAQRKLTEKSQSQVDRLLTIIENFQSNSHEK